MSSEATEIVFWEYDPVTGKITWPESRLSFARMDRPSEDLLSLLERLDPDDRPTVGEAFRAASEDEPLDVEFRVYTNGQLRWSAAWGRFVGDRHGKPRLLGLIID